MTVLLSGDPLTWDVAGDTSLTVGVFDGVHLGHQAVLREVVERASKDGSVPAVLTFDPHPLEFLAPARAPKLLTTVEQRAELVGACGIELLGVLPFLHIRDLPPVSFVVEVLEGRMHARYVAVGADFRFGKDRQGDPAALARIGGERGFQVEVVDMVGEQDGEAVSSTRIRAAVSRGQVERAAALLGRPFEVRGTVIQGEARGRSIGFPTANLHVPERMAVPADGVYAVRAVLDADEWPAVVNIGTRPTFGTSTRVIEAHLLDFRGDLYGRRLALRFVSRLRDERRFETVDALVAQIQRDIQEGRRVLGAAV